MTPRFSKDFFSLIAGQNQFTNWLTYFFIVQLAVCISVQMIYLNKALDTFNTSVVTPIYYVFFTTFVIIASAILYKVSLLFFVEDILLLCVTELSPHRKCGNNSLISKLYSMLIMCTQPPANKFIIEILFENIVKDSLKKQFDAVFNNPVVVCPVLR